MIVIWLLPAVKELETQSFDRPRGLLEQRHRKPLTGEGALTETFAFDTIEGS